jgi:hypothetical protein
MAGCGHQASGCRCVVMGLHRNEGGRGAGP